MQTNDAAQTIGLGAKLGQLLRPGDVLLLNGDLGAGKTTFTKGVAKALGIKRPVKSPTFTLIREYKEGTYPLYHMDMYRLENGGSDELGLEEYFEGQGIVIVEWSQFIQDELPPDYLVITIHKDPDNDDIRQIEFQPKGQRYEKIAQQLEADYHDPS